MEGLTLEAWLPEASLRLALEARPSVVGGGDAGDGEYFSTEASAEESAWMAASRAPLERSTPISPAHLRPPTAVLSPWLPAPMERTGEAAVVEWPSAEAVLAPAMCTPAERGRNAGERQPHALHETISRASALRRMAMFRLSPPPPLLRFSPLCRQGEGGWSV
jgi:hypothetical protein